MSTRLCFALRLCNSLNVDDISQAMQATIINHDRMEALHWHEFKHAEVNYKRDAPTVSDPNVTQLVVQRLEGLPVTKSDNYV